MDKKDIRHTLQKKIKKIKHLSADMLPDFDEDAIHSLRTEVKKLRSFMRLINAAKRRRKLKLPPGFKRLYYTVGAIREAQLEQKNLPVSLQAYNADLTSIVLLQQREWELHYSEKMMHKLQRLVTRAKLHPLHRKTFDRFCNERIAIIKGIMTDAMPADDALHTVRKRLKDMLYDIRLLKKRWPNAEYYYIQQELKDLTNLAGDYNDTRIRLQHLRAFPSGYAPSEERSIMLQYAENEKKRLVEEKEKLVAAIRKFIVLYDQAQ